MDTASTAPYPAPWAIVTGASSGIGAEVARALAERGYRLRLVARREDRLQALAARLPTEAACVAVDLADADALAAALPALAEGRVEVLVNNAGMGDNRRFLDQPDALTRSMMQVHFFAAATLIRAVLPGMLANGVGHVWNVASIATKWGPGGHSTYVAAKNALIGLTQSLGIDYADRGVAFTYVNPGLVRTEFFDHPSYAGLRGTLGKRGIAPAQVARRMVRLLDRPQPELCVPAHFRLADAIRALSPALMQRIVRRESHPADADFDG